MDREPLIHHGIPLAGSYNLRDIGGYETRNGHLVRSGMIFRSGNLDHLPLASQDALVNTYGVKTIVDLRSPVERERYPDVFASSSRLTYLALPLVDTTLPLWQAELQERYHLLLLHCQEALKTILEAIVTSDLPLLLHCTAGKDRTGLIIALLLSIAGVSEREIAADYALSERFLVPFFGKVRAHIQDSGGDMQRFERDCCASPELMRQTLAFLHHQFGGITHYLQQIGIQAHIQQYLKQRLITTV